MHRWKAMPSQANPFQTNACPAELSPMKFYVLVTYSLLITVVSNCKWDQAKSIIPSFMLNNHIKKIHSCNAAKAQFEKQTLKDTGSIK